MKIDRRDLEELMQRFSSSGFKSMEYEEAEFRLKFESAGTAKDFAVQNAHNDEIGDEESAKRNSQESEGLQNDNNLKESEADMHLTTVTSPIVGVFYDAQAPGEEPYVSEGQRVSAGEIICMIEAMKLMNEIKAEYDCIIRKINVSSGDMVEFGTVLFEVEKC